MMRRIEAVLSKPEAWSWVDIGRAQRLKEKFIRVYELDAGSIHVHGGFDNIQDWAQALGHMGRSYRIALRLLDETNIWETRTTMGNN